MADDGFIIDTPEGIALYRLLAVTSALRIEVGTGMKMSRGVSPLKIAQQEYGVTSRTKKGALAELEALRDQSYPDNQEQGTQQ